MEKKKYFLKNISGWNEAANLSTIKFCLSHSKMSDDLDEILFDDIYELHEVIGEEFHLLLLQR